MSVVKLWTTRGMLVTVAAFVIEIFSIYFQTDPGVDYKGIIYVLMILGITGAVLFAVAIWEWKQEVSSILVLILVVIGLVGFGASVSFHNALVDAFFPKTSISAFLGISFVEITMVGVFLWSFRGRVPVKRELEDPLSI
ncbi:MAG: hypothetical protein PVJ05_11460 [Candidatus Thorarchaeota archaeon]|jgi:hypothetical protein